MSTPMNFRMGALLRVQLRTVVARIAPLFASALLSTAPALHAQTSGASGSVTTPNLECSISHTANQSLTEFAQAYERGDLANIRERLDPAQIGLQRFMDGIQSDFTRLKQLRLHLKDVQLQCGPDVTVINATWEKRFLDVSTFQPGFQTGRMSVLLHRNRDLWRLAAVGGESPFGGSASGTAGDLVASPSVDISTLTVLSARLGGKAAPATLPLTITVFDGDQSGRGSVLVVISTSGGDREVVQLDETLPGRFSRVGIPFAAQTVARGDGVVQVAAGASLTLQYVDQTPGGNRPARVLSKTVTVTGTPITLDSVPDAFAFTPVANAAPGVAVTSAPITVTGINTAAPISITGGLYAINGGAFTSAAGTVSAGSTVTIRVNSSSTNGGIATAVLNIGGVAGSFIVTTVAADTTPDPFTYVPSSNAAPGTVVTSTPVTISGINAATPVTISGGAYSINGGAFTTSPGTINNGQTLTLQVVASTSTDGTGISTAVVNVGGVTSSFTVTTWDTVPNAFTWPASVACPAGTIDSAPVIITGLTAPATISIADGSGTPAPGALYSINGGAFTASPGTVSNSQTVTLRVTRYGTLNPLVVRAIVTIGGVTGTWSTQC